MSTRYFSRAAPQRGGNGSGSLVLLGAAFCVIIAGACRNDMHDQPKLKPYRESRFFDDGRSARPPVPGTVARGHLDDDAEFFTGKSGDKPTAIFPQPITREVLRRGQERYDIFCAPCHDRVGNGSGMIVRRGYRRPPSLHIDRLREAPVGQFFDVITNGFGVMPSYAAQIPTADRWAIVAYIRALQLSQNATLTDVPSAERAKLTRPQ